MEIVGDLDEAKTYNAAQRNANSAATVNQDEEDEGGASAGGGGSGRKKKHEDDEEETKESQTDETNNKSGKDKKDGEAARKRLLVSHPLKVKVTMNGLAAAGSLELAFEYLTQIKIVTVKADTFNVSVSFFLSKNHFRDVYVTLFRLGSTLKAALLKAF